MAKENYLKDLMGHVMQIIYMVFLGILIAVFFGLGIDTFYPGPQMPEYPTKLQETDYKADPAAYTRTDEEIAAQKSYDEAYEKYNKDQKPYARNVSMIAVALSVLALAVSLTVLLRWEVIANGVMLGGVFTLAYSIIRGVESQDPKFRFFLVTIGVVIALGLGYLKFVRPREETNA